MWRAVPENVAKRRRHENLDAKQLPYQYLSEAKHLIVNGKISLRTFMCAISITVASICGLN